MTKFMINNRTDAWKTEVNLLKVVGDFYEKKPIKRFLFFNWFTGSQVKLVVKNSTIAVNFGIPG